MPDQAQTNAYVNTGQQEVILHTEGPAMVLAGPGTGKTYTIIHRIRALIERGTDPAHILVITFTRAAAAELKDRFLTLTGGLYSQVSFGTFHAIFFSILKHYYSYTSNDLLQESEKYEIMRALIASDRVLYSEEDIPGLLSSVSAFANGICDPPYRQTDQASFDWIYRTYTEEKRRRGRLDFDDMTLQCLRLLKSSAEVRGLWQAQYPYLMVDEFQDTNVVQYEALKLLCGSKRNLCVIGDDDQSIYRFRGASPGILRRFREDFPEAACMQLQVNYRCRGEILAAAGRLIEYNRERLHKQLTAAKGMGGCLDLRPFETRAEQNDWLIKELKKCLSEGDAKEKIAVIFRTNLQAAHLAAMLQAEKLPFSHRESLEDPFAGEVCRDLLAYLRFAKDGRREDFLRIMNKPVRYLARNALKQESICIDELRKYYQKTAWMGTILDKLELDLLRIRRMDTYAAVNYIRKGIGYDHYLEKHAEKTGKDLSILLADADFLQGICRSCRTFEQLETYVRTASTNKHQKRTVTDSRICLETVHGVKGLEYHTVFLPDLNEGILPHKKSMRENQVEEERRLMYVAMTRAKERLVISWMAGTKEKPGFASRFISEINCWTDENAMSILKTMGMRFPNRRNADKST